MDKFIGFEKYIDFLNNWNLNNQNKTLLLTGPDGCGKTSLVQTFFKQKNYNIYNFNSNNFTNKANINKVIMQILYSKKISSILQNKKDDIIIIDEVKGIINNKGTLSEITDLIKEINLKKMNVKLVVIIDNSIIRKFNSIMNYLTLLEMNMPDNIIITEVVRRSSLKLTDTTLNYLIDISRNNLKKITNIVTLLKESNQKSNVEIKKILKLFKNKTKRDDLYSIVNKLITKDLSLNSIYSYYNNEKTLLCLMLHQNYLKYCLSNNNYISNIYEVSKILSESDNIENNLYKNNYWQLKKYFSYSCFYKTNKILNKLNKKPIHIEFTTLLNKNSLKSTYIKDYNKITDKINYYYVDKDIVKFHNLCKSTKTSTKKVGKYLKIL